MKSADSLSTPSTPPQTAMSELPELSEESAKVLDEYYAASMDYGIHFNDKWEAPRERMCRAMQATRDRVAVLESRAASLPTELNEALGVLVRVCQHMGAMFVEKGVPLPELKDGERDLSISAARSQLEMLYREQREERQSVIDEQRATIEKQEGELWNRLGRITRLEEALSLAMSIIGNTSQDNQPEQWFDAVEKFIALPALRALSTTGSTK